MNENYTKMVKNKKIDVKEFWIGFTRGCYRMSRFLKKGFQHTYVLTKDYDNWIELNPRNHALEFFVLPFKLEVDVPGLLVREKGHSCIYVKIEHRKKKNPNFNIFSTVHCVNIVKYIVGIKVFAYTPYQLYTGLLEMGDAERRSQGILNLNII